MSRPTGQVAALGLLRSRPQLLGLASINFIVQVVHAVFTTVWVLYVADRYRWTPMWVGLSMGIVGISSAVIQAGVVRAVVTRIGERAAMLTGLFFAAAGFLIFAMANEGWMFLVGIPILSLWGLTGPSVQSLMSRSVGPSEQGRLQGANTSLTSVAGLIGPGLFSAVFAWTLANRQWGVPGLPFVLAAALMLTAMFTAWRVTARMAPASQPA